MLPLLVLVPLCVIMLLWQFPSRYMLWLPLISSLCLLAFLLLSETSAAHHLLIPWVPSLKIKIHLAITPVSKLFLILTLLATSVSLFWERRNRYHQGWVVCLQWLLILFFTARNLFLLMVLWEAVLLPVYFLMSETERTHRGGTKFLFTMIAGSLFTLLGLVFLFLVPATDPFQLDTLPTLLEKSPWMGLSLAFFFVAFAVKTPLFPLHAWLPEVYEASPWFLTFLLSAVISKVGVYGLITVFLPVVKSFQPSLLYLLLLLSVIGSLYGGLAALGEKNIKKVLSYSSLSQMNFILAGLFTATAEGLGGAVLQTFNHTITTLLLFAAAAQLETRFSIRTLSDAGGCAVMAPRLYWCALLAVFGAIAIPGFHYFIGELLTLIGNWHVSPLFAVLLLASILITAAYQLRWIHAVFWNMPRQEFQTFNSETRFSPHRDLDAWDLTMFAPLLLLSLWIGLQPNLILDQITSLSQFFSTEAAS